MKNLLLAIALIFGVAAAPMTEAVAAPKKEQVQKKKNKKKAKKHHNRKVNSKQTKAKAATVAAAPAPVCWFLFWEVPCDLNQQPAMTPAAEQRKRIADGSKIISSGQKYVGLQARKDRKEITQLIHDRQAAKTRKDWPEADRIRKLLAEKGIALEDSPTGTTWRRE